MKERRKGFTLIELLAVIVILAIIALIATPIVLNLINTARKGAFARSAEGVLKASKLYYTSSLVEEVNTTTQEFTCDNKECLSEDGTKLDVDGNMGEGIITITGDGKISFELGNGTYCAEKEEDDTKITVTKKKCGELVINTPTNLQITYKTEKVGEITVVGSVSNKPAEIETCEFSIDNGNTWEKANLVGNGYMYTFTGLGVNETYTIKMRVTNKNNETSEINKEVKTSTVIMGEPKITPNDKEWSVSKTVELVYPEIDTNVYKKVYSLDGGTAYLEYTDPLIFTQNGSVISDIIKISDNTSILEQRQTINITGVDATVPTVSLEGIPDEIEEKTSYEIPTSYYVNNDLSGGSVTCTDENRNKVTNTNTLSIGEHTITCTVTTGAGNKSEASKTIKITEQKYKTGDALELGGYKWHVIREYKDENNRSLVTLLMDANQLGDNSNMTHCTSANNSSNNCTYNGTYYVYSWDKSLIRTYLNGEFLTNLESKIGNEIVSTSICADPSRGDNGTTYGGYLMSELNILGKAQECSNQVSDKVRLISKSEYYNMSPYYTSTDSNYPNVGNITKISTTSDYESWLYCSSNACGNTNGYWGTMGSFSYTGADFVRSACIVYGGGDLKSKRGELGVRPVVTIVK